MQSLLRPPPSALRPPLGARPAATSPDLFAISPAGRSRRSHDLRRLSMAGGLLRAWVGIGPETRFDGLDRADGVRLAPDPDDGFNRGQPAGVHHHAGHSPGHRLRPHRGTRQPAWRTRPGHSDRPMPLMPRGRWTSMLPRSPSSRPCRVSSPCCPSDSWPAGPFATSRFGDAMLRRLRSLVVVGPLAGGAATRCFTSSVRLRIIAVPHAGSDGEISLETENGTARRSPTLPSDLAPELPCPGMILSFVITIT